MIASLLVTLATFLDQKLVNYSKRFQTLKRPLIPFFQKVTQRLSSCLLPQLKKLNLLKPFKLNKAN